MGKTFGNVNIPPTKRINLVLPILLVILGLIFKFVLVGYSYTAYVLFALTACLLYFNILRIYCHDRRIRILKRISMIILIIFLVAYGITEIFIVAASFGDDAENADYLIVLGAGVNGTQPSLSLLNRLESAYKYLIDNPDCVCIVSGGQGEGEDITEARCMADWLKNKGISADRIIMEEKASSTEENVEFSLEIIRNKTDIEPKIAVLSSEYHLFRAKMLFKKAGTEAFGVPAKTTMLTLMINYFLREVPAVWKTALF